MKRLSKVFVMIMAVLSCCFFAACENKYDKLIMSVFDIDGRSVDHVHLVVDDGDDKTQEQSRQDISIEFAGINTDDIGQILVYSNPQGIVNVSNYRYQGNVCSVTLEAARAEIGELIIRHLSSNKSVEIPLTVDQKSTGIEVVSSDYVVDIGSVGDHYIDLTQMINLYPLGSTDKLYFYPSDDILPTGVTLIKAEENDNSNHYSGFRISENCQEGKVEIYPTTAMIGYTDSVYTDYPLTIHFKKLLSPKDMVIETSEETNPDAYVGYGVNAENPIYLMVNTKSDNYDLKAYKFKIKQKIEGVDKESNDLASRKYLDYYYLGAADHSNNFFSAIIGNDEMAVSANVQTRAEEIKIWLHPKNRNEDDVKYVGEISSISVSLYAAGVLRPEFINMTNRNETLEGVPDKDGNLTYSIDVSNYYANDTKGDIFGLQALTKDDALGNSSVLKGMNGVRISIDPRFVEKKENIYTDSNFEELVSPDKTSVTIEGNHSAIIGGYKHRLNFHSVKTEQPIKFYYDQSTYRLMSEILYDPSGVFIIVQDNSDGSNSEDLNFGFDVLSVNEYAKEESEHGYLGIEVMPKAHVAVNRKEGVHALTVYAGEAIDDFNSELYLKDNAQTESDYKVVDKIYIDRTKPAKVGTSNTSNKYFLSLLYSSVKNIKGDGIVGVDFEVSVHSASANNPIKLQDGRFKDADTSIEITHTERSDIYLVFDETTSVGEYKITFFHDLSKFTKTITLYVFETLNKENISQYVNLSTDDKLFKNQDRYNYYLTQAQGGIVQQDKSPLYDVYLVAANPDKKYALDITFSDSINDTINMSNLGFDIMTLTGVMSSLVKYENESFVPHYENPVGDYMMYEDGHLIFKEGTHIDEKGIRFARVEISMAVTKFKDILTPTLGKETVSSELIFFIYEELTNIKFDKSLATVYAYDYLGVYDKEDADLSVNLLLDNQDVLKYVQGDTSWQYDNSKIRSVKTKHNNKLELTYKKTNEPRYETQIVASITQFGKEISTSCQVKVDKPIISENIILNSAANIDNSGEYYIYMKAGDKDPETVEASNYSKNGAVTNPGLVWIAVDKSGFPITSFDIAIDNNRATISAGNTPAGEYYLIIFAKDALARIASSELGGYNNPGDFLMEVDIPGEDEDKYKSAYFRLKIILADGTEDNPYLIHTAEDFMDIASIDESEPNTSYYRVMRNIDLSSIKDLNIEHSNAIIMTESTDEDTVLRTVSGIKLDNNNINLITKFGGKVSDIIFDVNYAYDKVENIQYLGLIGSNLGTLKNVFIVANGVASAKGSDISIPKDRGKVHLSKTVFFGGLVGINAETGTIEYDYKERVGAQVDITLGGGLYFGGLVGLNEGIISGNLGEWYETPTTVSEQSNNIDFTVSIGGQDAIANVNINGSALGIGGVVGYNKATVQNAYVLGIITAKGTNNVGGLVGINEQELLLDSNENPINTVSITLDGTTISKVELNTGDGYKYQISNIVSSVEISAQNYVGGIVGYNRFGSIQQSNYQIVPSLNNSDKTKKTAALSGTDSIGGIVGHSHDGIISFSSVYSYWWDYDTLSTTFNSCDTDIKGAQNVAGLVGVMQSTHNKGLSGSTTILYPMAAITYSSVNAYIQGEGLANEYYNSTAPTRSMIFNAYFLGENESTQNLGVEIKYFNHENVYLKTNGDSYKKFPNDKTINSGSSNIFQEVFWSKADKNKIVNDYNSGYLYITRDEGGTTPLFEIAPTNISAKVKTDYQIIDDDTLVLNYYDFNDSSISISKLNELNAKYNTYSLMRLIDFSVQPSTLSNVRLYVTSSDSHVVSIGSNGQIRIEGTGSATLTFISVLNPSKKDTIKVEVITPIGDYYVTNNLNADEDIFSSVSIAKDKSVLLYSKTSGTVDISNTSTSEKYSYSTLANPHLKVEFKYADGVTIPTGSITDYIEFSGIDVTVESGANEATVYIPSGMPFTIKAKDTFDDAKFDIKVTPYIMIGETKVEEFIDNTDKANGLSKKPNDNDTFEVEIGVGATNISLSHSELLLYPNDRTKITAFIETDMKLEGENLNIYKVVVDEVMSDNYNDMIEIIEVGTPNDDNIQAVVYELTIDENKINKDNKTTIEVIFRVGSGYQTVYRSVVFTVLPQRIEKIDIQTYTEEYGYNTSGALTLIGLDKNDMIKPATEEKTNGAWAVIDMVPINGYFDYLEIRDITGSELIKFIQFTNSPLNNGKAETIVSTADGLGIKLKKIDGADTLYVYMQIEGSYTTKVHTLEVSAYINSQPRDALYRETINIQAKMMPKIEVDYNVPNGYIQSVVDSQTIYLAAGTNAELRVQVTDATTGLMWDDVKVTTTGHTDEDPKYEFVHDQGEFYILRYTGNPAEWINLKNKTISLELYAHAIEDNGEYEEARIKIVFKLTTYVVHSISVSPSINGEIYGIFGRETPLEFYLDTKDISYAGRESSDSTYHYNDTDKDTNLTEVYTVLSAINTSTGCIRIHNNEADVHTRIASVDLLNGRPTLIVKEKHVEPTEPPTEYKFEGTEKLRLDLSEVSGVQSNYWIANKINIKKDDYPDAIPTPAVDYGLSFAKPNSVIEPILITTEQEFRAMTSGDLYYALGNDLTFSEYVPMNVDIKQFDGNGHKITINSFDPLVNAEAKVGLFESISENMLVKNLTVDYNISGSNGGYHDITNNQEVNFTSVDFGGIASVNNGIITNCKVTGSIVVKASMLEARGEAMNIGGIVTSNASTGNITNSTSSLEITSLANIGGLAHSNAGKIVSSSSVDSKIYAYDSAVTATIIVEVAGFVTNNTGNISMSYLDLSNGKEMKTKDVSAGFVYNNSGTIIDCYSKVSHIDYRTTSNLFSGFVNSNSGTIERSYSYINNGDKRDANMFMFFRPQLNTGRLIDCIEIVNNNSYESDIGVVKYTTDNVTLISEFAENNFNFGGNPDRNNGAVWYYGQGLPKLVSTNETVTGVSKVELDNVYNGITAYKKVEIDTETGTETKYTEYLSNYGSRENPYIIHDLKSWNDYMLLRDIKGNLIGRNTGYFRIVRDIDFAPVGDNPESSKVIFGGNIQGNNMSFKNIMLRSNETLESIGLFESMEMLDGSVDRAVRNLTLTTSSIWATKTATVGVLAGVIEDYKLYNITIDSENVTIVGGNAVGGLAGIIRGNLDIEGIKSNVSVNSTRDSTYGPYSIYRSINNKAEVSTNIGNVHYAGSVAGIIDGYDSYSNFTILSRNVVDTTYANRFNNYYQVRNIEVSGNLIAVGDIVGGAFGFIGERVELDRVNVSISGGNLNGIRYSSMGVGENRGVITNARVSNTEDNLYANSDNVSGGIVGLNIGGLVKDSTFVSGAIMNNEYRATVGGIVGRNIGGTIRNVTFGDAVTTTDAEDEDSVDKIKISGHFTGLIIGAEYDYTAIVGPTSGNDSINVDGRNELVIPNRTVVYIGKDETLNQDKTLNQYEDLKVGKSALKYVLTNISSYYTYQQDDGEGAYNPLVPNRVLGLAIGISTEEYYQDRETGEYHLKKYYLESGAKEICIKMGAAKLTYGTLSVDENKKLIFSTPDQQPEPTPDPITLPNIVTIPLGDIGIEGITDTHILFLRGALVGSVNSWDKLNKPYDMNSSIIIN